jgi:hypothetical protein
MRTIKFIFEGRQGIIEVSQDCIFVRWSTLSCHLSALVGPLRALVVKKVLTSG